MDEILSPITHLGIGCYIDDIFVMTETFEQ